MAEESTEQQRRRYQLLFSVVNPPTGGAQTYLTGEGVFRGSSGLVARPIEEVAARGRPAARPPLAPRRTLIEFGEAGARPTVPVPEATAAVPSQRTLVPAVRPPELANVRGVPAAETSSWHIPSATPLRDYQIEALRAWEARRRGTIVLATGLGKTLDAIAAIIKLRVPTIVIVPTIPLIEQWVRELGKAGIRAGVYYGESKTPRWVTVSTYQSLYAQPDLVQKFPFIVFDEGDLSTSQYFRGLLDEAVKHPYAMLLTATPPQSADRRRELESRLPIVYERGSKEGIEGGHLVEPEIVPVLVDLTGEERKEYDKLSNTIRNIARYFRTANPQVIAKIMATGSGEDRAKAGTYLKAVSERVHLLSGAQHKVEQLVGIVRRVPNQRVFLFGESIATLEGGCRILERAGIGCRLVTGETNPFERRRALVEWGKHFPVLASAKVLERGIDVPSASVAIFLASGHGRTQLTQRLGRVLRPAPGKAKAIIYVIAARNTTDDRVLSRLRILTGQRAPDGEDDGEQDAEQE